MTPAVDEANLRPFHPWLRVRPGRSSCRRCLRVCAAMFLRCEQQRPTSSQHRSQTPFIPFPYKKKGTKAFYKLNLQEHPDHHGQLAASSLVYDRLYWGTAGIRRPWQGTTESEWLALPLGSRNQAPIFWGPSRASSASCSCFRIPL